MKIVFIEGLGCKPYTIEDISGSIGLGGTETSLLRISRELAPRHSLVLVQSGRKHRETDTNGVEYWPLEDVKNIGHADVLVILRLPRLLKLHKHFPSARVYFWVHDDWPAWPKWQLRAIYQWRMHSANATMIAVSMFHQRQAERLLRPSLINRILGHSVKPPTFIYNPTPEVPLPVTDYDRNQMIFASSPHKGIKKTIEVFKQVKRAIPEMKLLVTNPGYAATEAVEANGVEVLGVMDHDELFEKISNSLCYFGMQTHPENFGIIFAECHAMGVPVLTTPIGAAPEVVGDWEQLINADDVERVIARIKRWRAEGRPQASSHDRFETSKIARDWEMVLELSD
jgi:glycosyltransferase involved in cell wall biosynthesis